MIEHRLQPVFVAGEATTAPLLFADYVRDRNHTDYRRFLRFAEPVVH